VVGSADLPAGESTYYADKGTVVHAVIENCINTGRTAESYKGEIVCEVEMPVDAEMIQSANFCLEYIKRQGFTHVEAEQVVELPWIKNPDGESTTGKVDFVGYDEDFEVLKVGDYKNGYQPVESRSYQFAMYLMALVLEDDSPYKHLDRFTTVLVQPNSAKGPTIVEEEWTKAELEEIKKVVKAKTEWVKQSDPIDLEVEDYCEGSWCKFCPLAKADAGSAMCPKKTQALFDDVAGEQAVELMDNKLPAPSKMTREQRAMVLGKRKDITKWLDDVYKIEFANAQNGDVPPGMKLVEGRRKPRYWLKGIDTEDIGEALIDAGLGNDDIHDDKLISPATVKKLLKGKLPPEIEAYMTPDEKSIELVSADDKRESSDGSDMFD